ncbi:glycosyltransferase [Actinomadura latina]|uniref:Glycosyltransferase n=1 Tax=Actinomadura latina TaxID=163603 RepID=A0A846YV41_9ACTN|nr:glycosyltransferase [Actinomadura latina]NKZ02474.1 glycosyltransferase [Actinomadura latina]
MSAGTRVTAVVVTHNRRELLTEALAALAAQTRPPDAVIVVDNASTDGTAGLVRERFPGAELLVLGVNTGGAGGFAAGIARALDAPGTGLLWLMDDDTVPEPGALAALLDARDRASAEPALIASRVVWTDGRDHPMNTPRVKPGASRAELAAAAEIGCRPVRSASFVSVLLDAAAVRERGLPVADYFLWNDDFEFTTRLLRGRTGLYCPASVVVHKTRTFGGTDADPGDRFYYEVRNKLWLFTRSRGLAPAERVLYAGSSARRWARTYLRSQDRATLRKGLREGVRDGLRRRPRPTEEVISAAMRRYDP